MNITLQQTEKLLKGNLAISQISFSMMVTLLKSRYAKAPTQETLKGCTDEINVFLGKYGSIMGNDVENITKL